MTARAKLHELELERNAHAHAHAKEAIQLLDLIHPDPATFAGYIAARRHPAGTPPAPRQATKLSRKLSGQ